MKKQLTEEIKKRMERIATELVIRNMRAGSTFKLAKEQAFNRLEKEYPTVLNAWLNQY